MNTDFDTNEALDEYSTENPLSFNIPYGMALTAEFARITTIVTQPADCTVLVGGRGVFAVEAVGDDLRYQWAIDRLDGRGWQELRGAVSAEYRTSVVTLANNGYRYRCMITDAEGQTVTTNEAVLHVGAVPPATGDGRQPMLWIVCVVLGAVGLGALLLRRRRAG